MRETLLISIFFIFRSLLCVRGGGIILMTQPSTVLFCWLMLPQWKITSLIFFPCMIKFYCIYWGTYQSVGTHLFQDNLAPEILLMTFASNWIARTEPTIQLTPSFIILASVHYLDKLRLPSLGYDRHLWISLTHEYK